MIQLNILTLKTSLLFLMVWAIAACDTPGYENFDDWDLDEDTYIDNKEFHDGILGSDYYYGLFKDAEVDYSELYDAYYVIWDLDNDNTVDQEEWNRAVDLYYENYDERLYGSFDDWDLNNNGEIDLGEYRTGLEDTNLFMDWDLDKDELINEEEFSQGIYPYWDTDGDGKINEVEYQEWDSVYRD